MKWTFVVGAFALAGAAGCMTTQSTPEPSEPAAVTACGAENYQSFVGQTEAAFAAVSFPEGAMRVVCHNCAVTMDYREERINFWLDAEGKIARVNCG